MTIPADIRSFSLTNKNQQMGKNFVAIFKINVPFYHNVLFTPLTAWIELVILWFVSIRRRVSNWQALVLYLDAHTLCRRYSLLGNEKSMLFRFVDFSERAHYFQPAGNAECSWFTSPFDGLFGWYSFQDFS